MRYALFTALLALAACNPEEEATPESDLTGCGADTLQDRVGDPVNAHDFDADGRPLRILPPDSAMTMDHRPDRLNVDVDKDGVIVRIWCG